MSSRERLLVNLRVCRALGRRSTLQTFRRPQLMAPIIVFPTLLLAVQTGGAGAAVELPGFPQGAELPSVHARRRDHAVPDPGGEQRRGRLRPGEIETVSPTASSFPDTHASRSC